MKSTSIKYNLEINLTLSNYHKTAKPCTREYYTEKNINVRKNLISKTIDSDNFLAGENLAASPTVVWGVHGGGAKEGLRVLLGYDANLEKTAD